MNEVLFLGASTGIGEKSGKPYYVLFLGKSISEKGVGVSCWSPLFVEEEEYTEIVKKAKPMQKIKVKISRGVLKYYEI